MVVLRRVGLVLAMILGVLALPGPNALATTTPTTSSAPADGLAPVTSEVVASVADGQAQVIALTDAPGDQVVDDVVAALPDGSARDVRAGTAPQVTLTVDAEGLDALRAAPGVDRVVEDKVNRIAVETWETAVGLPTVVNAGWDGSGRTVAILDTGVQADHPYLDGKVVAEACFSHQSTGVSSLCPNNVTVAHGTGTAAPCPSNIPGCAHGTHVAGIAAGGPVGTPRPLRGVASGASIIAVKVFSLGTTDAMCGSAGSAPCLVAYDSDINAALSWLAQSKQDGLSFAANLDAVNLSLGGGLYSGACDDTNALTAAVNNLRDVSGVATVVASGNNGQGSRDGTAPKMASPACISTTVSVGATTGTGSIATYSNLTAATTLLAPGSSIYSSVPGSVYGTLSGTSMATPIVTGSIAVLRERTPGASVSSLVSTLRSSGEQITTPVGFLPEVQLDSALLGVPGAVQAVTASGGDATVGLTWQTPAYAGTSSITSYTATAAPGGQSCNATVVLACTVANLTNGTAYTFEVTATNSSGTGSGVSVVATPRTVSGAPAAPSAVAGDRSAVVSWQPPASNGGSAVVGYRVTASPSGQTCVVGGLTCTVTGLPNRVPTTFSVVATNAAGDSAASGPSGAVTPTLPGVSPFGSIDLVGAGVGSVTVAGWALDPETRSPIPVHVYVDGAGYALTADVPRGDVDAAFGYGSGHGFVATLPASGGAHTVCIYAINVGAGSNALLGCRGVTVSGGSPFGSIDVASAGVGTVSVSGWAIDPDTSASIQVHVYVDGVGYAIEAMGSRPDVGAAYPGYGSPHGFGATVSASGGAHTVCIYAINVGAGSNALLGCRGVTVPGGSPFGSLDTARRNPNGTISVAGWAIDPDTRAPIEVHVYFISPTTPLGGIPLVAGQSRPDVGAAYPAYGSGHGYSVTLSLPPGAIVCAYAINTGIGETVGLRCASVP